MAKEELLEFEGTVTEVLPDGNFRVKLENDHTVLAYAAGKMRKFRIRTIVGDRVTVECRQGTNKLSSQDGEPPGRRAPPATITSKMIESQCRSYVMC